MIAVIAGLFAAQHSFAQTTRPPITQEYLVRQGADEDLLITINAFEAEFESRIHGQAGELLLHSSVTGNRLVPVFQYVPSSGEQRQLNIGVTSSQYSAQSQFGLELTRLTVWDDRSSALSRAYGLLSFGMQAGTASGGSNWTVKIDSLVNAGRIFQQFGMKEMRLWANFLAAHLVELHLQDHSIAYSMTREMLRDLQGSRLQKIELAVLQLQSKALIGLKRTGALQTSADNPDPVQAVLSRAAALAASMGFQFEQASALNASAVEYAAESDFARALEQFQAAVTIADSVGETEFATEIRESMVQIHTSQGNTPATGEVLREIETQLAEDGGGDELALNLLAQGRLLSRSYRYKEAISVLGEALLHENNSAIRRQVNFALARAFYESGRFDESLAYFRLAGVEADNSRQKRPNTMIDMGDGLRILANIYRFKADFERMHEARSAQAGYQTDTSGYLYEQGLDELAATGKLQKARSFFSQSHAAAVRSGHVDIQHLSRLRLCARGGAVDGLCRQAALRKSYDWLSRSGIPRFSIEAMWLWSQILDSGGQQSAAVTVMDKLLNQLHFLRHSLPGVLGSWYRENSQALFDDALGLQLRYSRQGRAPNGTASLLAVTKIRHIGNYSDFLLSPGINPEDTEALRMQLAQRAEVANGTVPQSLVTNINRRLEEIRLPFDRQFAYLSKAGMQSFLRSLSSDETLLTYHISPTTAQVWVGSKGRVERRDIKNPADTLAALQAARRDLAGIGGTALSRKMVSLGTRLLDPVEDLLTRTIYLVPTGSLLGFPFDALRINGYPVVKRHTVINLASFPANPNPAASLASGTLDNVFIAGHPQEYSGVFATRLDTSPEISAVADVFIGPGLRIVQGVALLPDEFQGGDFQQADLLHLSMPGVINPRYPEQSSLELSGDEYSPLGVLLRPVDLQSQQLSAKLVFLSATRMEEYPTSNFSAPSGLIPVFLGTGARSVIVNTMGEGGDADQSFITDFYRKLELSGNVATAFRNARLQYLEDNRDTGLYDWAGYQLFIN